MTDTLRVMRVAMPVGLVRKVDQLVGKRVGGYETRTEFIVDSVRQNMELLLAEAEGNVEEAGVEPAAVVESRVIEPQPQATFMSPGDSERTDVFEGTEIRMPGGSQLVTEDGIVSRPERKALFGLHNRDYPSLWAAGCLAAMTRRQLVPVDGYLDRVVHDAWEQGSHLQRVQEESGQKTTALFPTNLEKRKSAEAGFRMFAVGRYHLDPEEPGAVVVEGPLFQWQVAALEGTPEDLKIGLTSPGHQLLASLDGLTVEEPHPQTATETFLAHLAEWANDDYRVLMHVISAVGTSGATRQDLLESVGLAWPSWTENEVSTNTAGYVARAREWGLLKAKQETGRYQISELGHRYYQDGGSR